MSEHQEKQEHAGFGEKFVAYIDILGFSEIVSDAERSGNEFDEIIRLTKMLGSSDDAKRFAVAGPPICPQSRYISRDLNFKFTQISDCAVISAEVSPAGIINLANHCFGVSLRLLTAGHLCRGAIVRGNVHHTESQVIGTAYMEAYAREHRVTVFRTSEAEGSTPFIEIDLEVVRYVSTEGDQCVREMFGRITKSDGVNTAIWPFDALAKVPSALIDKSFDPVKFKESVQRSRSFRSKALSQFERAEAAATDAGIRLKIQHYKAGLQDVIRRLNEKEARVDAMIATGVIPYGTKIV